MLDLPKKVQYELNKNVLTLRVKKTPPIIRGIFFFLTFVFAALPLTAVIASITNGDGFHFIFVVSLGIFGLITFYMLRLSLWNTYGKEVIKFEKGMVNYEADYGWFKDGAKSKEIKELTFSIHSIGYEEDNKGVLIIDEGEDQIRCVTKMPKDQLEELILKLKNTTQSTPSQK